MGVLLSPVAKTLVVQTTQALMRTTGLGVTAAADAILDDANNGAILTTLGITAFAQTILDDADATTARTTLGAGVGWTFQAKSTNFTAADAYSYDVDSSGGAVIPTCPAAAAGLKFRIKLRPAGNNCTVTRAGADTIDGATTYVMSQSGENYSFEVDNTGTNWAIFG